MFEIITQIMCYLKNNMYNILSPSLYESVGFGNTVPVL